MDKGKLENLIDSIGKKIDANEAKGAAREYVSHGSYLGPSASILRDIHKSLVLLNDDDASTTPSRRP